LPGLPIELSREVDFKSFCLVGLDILHITSDHIKIQYTFASVYAYINSESVEARNLLILIGISYICQVTRYYTTFLSQTTTPLHLLRQH
jgi:hypothetical protein